MIIYKNQTRFPAIVTVKVESTEDAKEALDVGSEDFYRKYPADKGYHDILVDAGSELRALNNTNASVLGVRNAN